MSSLNDALSANVQSDQLQIFIASWNMGNAPHQGFETVFAEKDAFNKFDIFVLGLQESTYTSELDSIAHLRSQLEKIFGNFYIVQHCYRAQLQLFVFAKPSLRNRITNIEQSIENTGFLGVFPNKGGLLVTFQVDGSKFAFVSCHLAAHEGIKYCEARNASIVEILGGVRAGDRRYDITEQFHHVFWMGDMNYRLTYDKDNTPKSTRKNVPLVVQQTSVTLGLDSEEIEVQIDDESGSDDDFSDDEGIPPEERDSDKAKGGKGADKGADKGAPPRKSLTTSEVDKVALKKKNKKERARTMQMICDGQFTELMKLDELNREILHGRVLNGFTALQPAFNPTFKRTRNLAINPRGRLVKRSSGSGTSQLVTDFYNKKRMPSYCDRILHKSLPAFARNLKNLFFESCENAVSSDHKPVRAGYAVNLTKGVSGIRMNSNVLTSDAPEHTSGLLSRGGVGRAPSRQSSANFSHTPADNIDLSVIHITINSLRGHKLEDMDLEMFGGGSDPYLIVTTDPPCLQLVKNARQSKTNPHRFYFSPSHEGVKSSVVIHNCDPLWRDTLSFHIASTDFAGLAQNASFVFSVWDQDMYNADDLIGCFTIPFRDIIASHAGGAKTHSFESECYSNSEIMGKIFGNISIEGDVHELHKHFQEPTVKEKLVTLADAGKMVLENPSLSMHQSAGCCTIN